MAVTPQVQEGSEVDCGTHNGQCSGLASQGLHSKYLSRGPILVQLSHFSQLLLMIYILSVAI